MLHYTPDPMIGPTLLGGSQDLRELLTEKVTYVVCYGLKPVPKNKAKK